MVGNLTKAVGLLLLLCGAMGARADDAADVRSAIEGYYAAMNSGSFDRVAAFMLPEGFTEFANAGGPRVEITPAYLKGYFDRGLKADLHVHDVKVQMLGSDAACATYYRTGTLDPEGKGNAKPKHLRTTSVWLRREGHWYLVHLHNSPYIEPAQH